MSSGPGLRALVGIASIVGLTACSDDPTAPNGELVLLSVMPAGGSMGVRVSGSVVVSFDHALMPSMVEHAALHEGGVQGPEVEGAWPLADDGMGLTLTPAQALKPATSYTIDLGGGMEGDHGELVNFDMHGSAHMGGQWATGSMLSGAFIVASSARRSRR